ncbi:MAG: acyl-CoA dehydrogenase family protein [Planctomycetes bacterium]|nr:acyl-CoA dehydrogenase family protein [Planctomycetota bacterium]
MANFFTDNEDIQFLFKHMDIAALAELLEEGFRFHKEFDFAPESAADAVDNYERILTALGELVAESIAPTAEETDLVGNVLNDNGLVTYAPGVKHSLERLSQAQVMGFTLPYRFGGLNCPTLIFTMNNDMVSRADASLMNIYGLQAIAETINAFACEEIKREYLPRMASGELTGAMVLTEPDAGSDLQAVSVQAYQDDSGQWFVRGVKRFITNGCGEVLLVLARSEPEISDGRGLSLVLVERGPQVKVRRLEDKLGIHGSPTCEIFFDDAPGRLIGVRQRGLITYVMSLMNGARLSIAAQALGIAEAAYRVARDYAHSRKQFGRAIEEFPAVRELLVNMSVDLQAARALTYYSAFCVDLEHGALRKLDAGIDDKNEKKRIRNESRKVGRYNKLLTPMCKYYASEMSMRVSNDSMAVLGGSGYMRDYAVERHLRDARITTIYEGTSQLQVTAVLSGVLSGTAATLIEELLNRNWPAEVTALADRLREGLAMLNESVEFVKSQAGTTYRDLYARKLADIAIYLIVGALFCDHATASEKKLAVAKYWLAWRMDEIAMLKQQICSGEAAVVEDFETLAGPVAVLD